MKRRKSIKKNSKKKQTYKKRYFYFCIVAGVIAFLFLFYNRLVILHEHVLSSQAQNSLPTFDTQSMYPQKPNSTPVKKFTWNHTTTTSQNSILIAEISLHNNNVTVSSVTYAGKNLNPVPGGTKNCIVNICRAEIWYIVSPPTGTNTIIVTSSANTDMAAESLTYSNVDPVYPLGAVGTNADNTKTASVTVSSSPNNIIIDILAGGDNATWTNDVSQNSLWSNINNVWGSGSSKVGATSNTTMTWNGSIMDQWAQVAVALNGYNPPIPTMTLTMRPTVTIQPTVFTPTIALNSQINSSLSTNTITSQPLIQSSSLLFYNTAEPNATPFPTAIRQAQNGKTPTVNSFARESATAHIASNLAQNNSQQTAIVNQKTLTGTPNSKRIDYQRTPGDYNINLTLEKSSPTPPFSLLDFILNINYAIRDFVTNLFPHDSTSH